MKALVPAGFMVGATTKLITIEICADASGGKLTRQMTIPLKGSAGGEQSDHGKSDATCAWTALATAAHFGADSELLVLALAFILALGFLRQAAEPLRRSCHIRPPSRGPPLPA
ncbi:hypothetical protein PE061_01405 [Sphingosinicella microcystinivorans]|nr:DUF2946 family protein [Sphingosinicella microcystinivorans]WBX84610.1 hypothetical protein PE061_01405 [Sphingosinicella microcystinivorans]